MLSRMLFGLVRALRICTWAALTGLAFVISGSVNAETNPSLWKSISIEAPNTELQSRVLQSRSLQSQSLQSESLQSESLQSNSSYHTYEEAKLMTLNEELMRGLLRLDESGVKNYSESHSIDNTSAKSSESFQSSKTFKPSQTFEISLPLPDGRIIDLNLVDVQVLPQRLAQKYSNINTYSVLSNDLVFSGKVDISPYGFHAMLHMLDGNTVFIDPTDVNKSEYAIYNKSAQKAGVNRRHSCGLTADFVEKNRFGFNPKLDVKSLRASPVYSAREASSRSLENMKNYTIAIATTGEYAAKFGGSVNASMAAITTTLNRVNQLLERDLGIHLNLAENNDLLINTNASSDPFTTDTLLDLVYENQEFIDATIGSDNYDIGHLFTTSGGGLAAIASICNNDHKGKGVSGINSPTGDSFDLEFVAHEIGHQLGATHTFNSYQGACSAETRTARTAFEPGSGSSIMSYAGYCGLDNLQSSSDAMYHIGSIKQITQYTEQGHGASCAVVTSTSNTPPIADAGKDYKIPARTPFELAGDAIDSDGDSLIYAWEQIDTGEASTVSTDTGDNALFRVHTPNKSKNRSFPPIENLLNHTVAKGEALPVHQRTLNMSFVAQDGFNAAQSDSMQINVLRTGSRFALNLPRTYYERGKTYPVYWNVANTDIAPINCSSVDVSLSINGGKDFDYLLANAVPNTGETQITFPADVSVSAQGRLKLKCSDNIFFAVSYRDFFITQHNDSVSQRFDNEDRAEPNLNDLPLGEAVAINSTDELLQVSVSSGGGVFNMIMYLFVLVFIKRFRLYKATY